jgi:hypothetical protein
VVEQEIKPINEGTEEVLETAWISFLL